MRMQGVRRDDLRVFCPSLWFPEHFNLIPHLWVFPLQVITHRDLDKSSVLSYKIPHLHMYNYFFCFGFCAQEPVYTVEIHPIIFSNPLPPVLIQDDFIFFCSVLTKVRA